MRDRLNILKRCSRALILAWRIDPLAPKQHRLSSFHYKTSNKRNAPSFRARSDKRTPVLRTVIGGVAMEEGQSILEAIYEEDNLEDVEMVDIEEGEVVDGSPQTEVGQSSGGDVNVGNQGSQSRNRRRRANKKKNRKKSGSVPNVTDINRFVLDTCRRLKEKKSYLVYTAVGCLGVSALSDLVSEVNAIQACGGQMTADGRRHRTGGGILWSIIKSREPAAYKEIMKKGKEFEKQFRQPNIRPAPEHNRDGHSEGSASSLTDGVPASVPDGPQPIPLSGAESKRRSVHERIRVAVSYDDLPGEEPSNDST